MSFERPPGGWAKPRQEPTPQQLGARKPGFVYFIQAGFRGPVKIGWASDPRRRLGELQVGSTKRLELIGLMAGTREDERRLHGEVAQYRLRGEWFALPSAVRAQIRRNCPPP